jgi:hypothetical protein
LSGARLSARFFNNVGGWVVGTINGDRSMAETLGSLCDKLTIVKLKEFHTDDPIRLESLAEQAVQLATEIDAFVAAALRGEIPFARLTFAANKVFKESGNEVPAIIGTIGATCARLAEINCKLWHEQEHVYEFERVPADQKDHVVKQLALLNLQRNHCIDQIDAQLRSALATRASPKL